MSSFGIPGEEFGVSQAAIWSGIFTQLLYFIPSLALACFNWDLAAAPTVASSEMQATNIIKG
jgi:hypothetical protein